MPNTFKPRSVPPDVISLWPSMALALWKRSFKPQAVALLIAAFVIKLLPDWKISTGFLIAPPLFFMCFHFVKLADENRSILSTSSLRLMWLGLLRIGRLSFKITFAIGLGIACGIMLIALFPGDPPTHEQQAAFEEIVRARPTAVLHEPQNLILQFVYFCAGWVSITATMAVLGLFVIGLYQGVFGAILHAQEGLSARMSRIYAWQAWNVNKASFDQALLGAPRKFWKYVLFIAAVLFATAQTIYLSPVGLVVVTYIPSLTYVAYRSIFFGKHENAPATSRVITTLSQQILVPASATFLQTLRVGKFDPQEGKSP